MKRRSGAILVWVLVFLSVIIGIAALGMDGGRLMDERRRNQKIADVAALAAGEQLYLGYWTSHGKDPQHKAKAAAKKAAQDNGLDPADVSVNVPPTSGAFAGQASHAEVVIKTQVSASFGRIFSGDEMDVAARSVVRGQPMKLGIVLLKPSGPDAFLNQGLAFTLLGAPLRVNSTDPSAYRQASFGAVIASRFDLTGGYTNPGGAIILARIRTGVPPVADPLAYLPIPTSSTIRSNSALTINSILPTVLTPGVYRGGISIRGLSIVTMMPGVYIMEGGGFQVTGLATVAGLETVIYNTTGTAAAGPITVDSLGKVILTAPLSGTYQGINFFQNRAMTEPISVKGVGLTTITGTIYGAKAPIRLNGLAAVGADLLGGAYVADSMTVQGVGGINIDLGLNPPRIPDVRLVE